MSERVDRILLIDDDPDIVWGLGRLLTRAGYAMTVCRDGAEALSLLERGEFRVLITDIQMPKVNGLALLEWLRQNRPQLPTVVITAYGSPTIRDMTVRRGAALYLEKPVDAQMLLDALKSIAQGSASRGVIDGIDLADCLQFLLMTRRSAVIEVVPRAGDRGFIYVNQGNVLHATDAQREGKEAFFSLLAAVGGSFCTLPWREPERTTINESGEHLLLDFAQMSDEGMLVAETATDDGALAFDGAFEPLLDGQDGDDAAHDE
jgi:CheY-like chemotaxis protein